MSRRTCAASNIRSPICRFVSPSPDQFKYAPLPASEPGKRIGVRSLITHAAHDAAHSLGIERRGARGDHRRHQPRDRRTHRPQ